MARIPTYSTDTNISTSDKLLGTDADNANATKNFTVGELKTFVNADFDTILGYKSYSAKWTQQGTAAPVVTELQNNTGVTFTWSRPQVGTYVITASSAVLLSNKTFVNIQGSAYSSPPQDKSIIVQPSLLESNATTLNYRAIETDTTTLVDGNSGWIEIRIYN